MSEGLILVWVPFLLVVIAEHFILTRLYKKPSSLQRLRALGNSAKADLSVWFFHYIAWTYAGAFLSLVTIPGLTYYAIQWLHGHVQWKGLIGLLGIEQVPLAWLVWLIAVDLSIYGAHVLMHKTPFLWKFHELHHAATEFNVVTGIRVSAAEFAFNQLATFLFVTLILGLPSAHVAFTVMFIYRVVDLIQHSDLPWDFGPFDYIIASPRFHRMHHSSKMSELDSNYGNIFSFWDYLFGSTAHRYEEDRAIADSCTLGLADKKRTQHLNETWHFAALRTTLLMPLYEMIREKKWPPFLRRSWISSDEARESPEK